MRNYQSLKTMKFSENLILHPSHALPELVHLDDPSFSVMTDFKYNSPETILPDEPMDNALNEMKVHGVHQLIVLDHQHHVAGIVSSEDLLGTKPVKLIHQRRVERSKVLVKHVMTAIGDIPAFDMHLLEIAKVGNIVMTLKKLRTHSALVVQVSDNNSSILRGMFSTSQISRQLHMDISEAIAKAQSLSELQKRHT